MDFSRALCHTEFKPDEMFEHSELSRWSSILFKTFKLKASFESLDAGHPIAVIPLVTHLMKTKRLTFWAAIFERTSLIENFSTKRKSILLKRFYT